jgi:hypothetical protein
MKTSAQKSATASSAECTEQKRLNDARDEGIPWKKWGPYLSERKWGTVREDYSHDGNAWDYFSHDQARVSLGEKTESQASPTTNNNCALLLPFGTDAIPFSRSACLD